jgi:hypothetical protein
MAVCCPGWTTDSHPKKNNKYQLLHTYGLPPDDGTKTLETGRFDEIYLE